MTGMHVGVGRREYRRLTDADGKGGGVVENIAGDRPFAGGAGGPRAAEAAAETGRTYTGGEPRPHPILGNASRELVLSIDGHA